MSKPESRPTRVDAAELDEAIQSGVDRAEKTNELTQDDLDGATGGTMATPGKMAPYIDQSDM